MSNGPVDLADVLANGGNVDADHLYRSLPYLIDPEWTRGHAYLLRYAIGEQSWDIEVRDGEPIRVSRRSNGREPDSVVEVSPTRSASSSAASCRRRTRCACSSRRSRARSTR